MLGGVSCFQSPFTEARGPGFLAFWPVLGLRRPRAWGSLGRPNLMAACTAILLETPTHKNGTCAFIYLFFLVEGPVVGGKGTSRERISVCMDGVHIKVNHL